MRERRSVWDLESDPDDKTLYWYGRAVAALRELPASDSRSWTWLAAVHGTALSSGPDYPPVSDQQRYWSKCQHGVWFFLPWHRMYLHFFEQIVAEQIKELGGPDDWALPYWSYYDEQRRRLPPSFSAAEVDGVPNPLYDETRIQAANNGELYLDEVEVELGCLDAESFSRPSGTLRRGFGGTQTGPSHFHTVAGALEMTPHNQVHSATGGNMANPQTAALDPIFWLHHANIDRLWEVWRGINTDQNANPSSLFWRRTSFLFRDGSGSDVWLRCRDVVDTGSALLSYSYDDTADPREEVMGIGAGGDGMADFPQLVGATEAPITVALGGGHVRALVRTPHGADATDEESFGIGDTDARVFVQIENVVGDANASALDVYIGLPEGDELQAHRSRRIARLPMFGVALASDASGPHGGSGLSFSIEITHLLEDILPELDIDGDGFLDLPISFEPISRGHQTELRIGRVSIYRE